MKQKGTNFQKFYKGTEKKGAAKKEQLRQERKQYKKERKEFFDQKRAENRQAQETGTPSGKFAVTKTIARETPTGEMPLNKYLAHSGVCSRRDAADVVRSGKVKVNGQVVTEPGHKVTMKDDVRVGPKKVYPTKDLVYILLNKPKDYLTTTDDPQKRKTVLDLIQQATTERVYPVGRLDRNTSGVLLLTNDGDLAQKLTHPSNEVKKIYAVTLDKPLTKEHFDSILKGVHLEDGVANVDVLAYTDNADKTQIGVEIHSGRNRIVRRIFEHFHYDVRNLDRVMFAGLTKKNVNRGKWRFLTEKEVRDLKFFKKGKK
ncbi:pseudouridine synthase [Flavisolibacter tropicus]|uniref:Pseudouridine synthase n=1 Tax=Flavisolibacter tropicus TaxID=1492898 RepID=A0A172TVE7_9BACT|nr:pseudouridine synthase [Flavisolibacter tropicus]ANE50972.1 pseudouridine synthase [Flavisolibacter tropicus]